MIENILANLKIERLNPMQEASIDAWKEGKDLILLSPTGSGKTLAYLLPLVQSLKPGITGVQAIVLVPSRELALQIDQVFKSMNTPFKAVSCYGGRPAMEEHRTIKGQLPGLQRRFLLSATDAEEIPQFTGLNKTIKLNFLNPEEQLTQRLHLYKVLSPEKDKLETLYKLLCTLGSQSTLVFCNHRESVERVGKYLQSKKFQCGIFHGGMEQDDRERSLYKFRNGSCHVLISTDLAARGLDIPEIENVVHYHLPANEDGYIHRNGRTARWEAEGNSYVILHAEETLPGYIADEPEEFILPQVPPKPSLPEYVTLYIGKGKKDKINKIDIVGFLFKKGNLNKDEIGRIDVKDHYSFAAVSRKKIKQTLNLIRNEKIKGIKTLIEEAK